MPTHYHAKHFETFYLLAGEAEWTVNGETHKMKPGDAVYIPANALHSAMTLGTSPAHFILIYSHGDYEAHRARGGVRIEDGYLVRVDGCELLSTAAIDLSV